MERQDPCSYAKKTAYNSAYPAPHAGRLEEWGGQTYGRRSILMSGSIFHLAFPIYDIDEAIRFYVDGLGCVVGRRSTQALMFGLAGHQLVGHVVPAERPAQKGIYPRHFGLIFHSKSDWQILADRAKVEGLSFYQQPRIRFPGTRIEHRTFFLEDPSHNLLEFK